MTLGRIHGYRIAVLLGAAALAVIGCGGDDDSSETGPSTNEPGADDAGSTSEGWGPDCSDVDLEGTSVDEFDGCINADGDFQVKAGWECPDGQNVWIVKPLGDDGPSYWGMDGDVWHEDPDEEAGNFGADCSGVPGYGG